MCPHRTITVILCLAGAAVPSAPAAAGQSLRADVFGILQVGRQVRPVTVDQTGAANIAGVMQVGRNPSAMIRQNGQNNAAFVTQYGTPIPFARPSMP